MATDSSFLDQLADVEVPVPPPEFQHELHGRLNDWLLIVHASDLIAGAFPFAIKTFARAVGGLLGMTITGSYPSGENDETRT